MARATRAINGKPMSLQPDIVSTDAGNRQAMIAEAAYYLSQQRTGTSGSELEDWLAAEERIISLLPEN